MGMVRYCDDFVICVQRKKFSTKIKEMHQWRNTASLELWWSTLVAKLRGHFQYYGVSGNFRGIKLISKSHTIMNIK